MTRISGAEAIMPILTASGRMSSNTASIWWAKNSGVTGLMSRTPAVF